MRAYRTVSCSVTGYRKMVDALPCEDSTRVVHTKTGTILAVADGHGDKRCLFATVGSRMATKAATNVLRRYLNAVKGDASVYWNSLRDEIAKDIAKAFACYVIDDYRIRCKDRITYQEASELQRHISEYFQNIGEAMTPNEIREKYIYKKRLNERICSILFLYGTTVRATVLTDSYLFNCALGDGDTIAIIDDRVEWLLPKSEAYDCETTSLCEPIETVIESFVFSFIQCRSLLDLEDSKISDTSVCVSSVLLSTDGFRNSFFSQCVFEKKIIDLLRSAQSNIKTLKRCKLKTLYEKLSMESVFQDDISTIIAIRTE